MMKKDAVLVNASRGPVVDEVALVKHLQENPNFRSALQCHLLPFTCNTEKIQAESANENRKYASLQPITRQTWNQLHLSCPPWPVAMLYSEECGTKCFSSCVDCRAGLDVFEDEPKMKPGLADCENAVIVPHIASASLWTRAGMVRDAQCSCLWYHPGNAPHPEVLYGIPTEYCWAIPITIHFGCQDCSHVNFHCK